MRILRKSFATAKLYFIVKELEKSAIEDREQLSSIEQFTEQISGYAGIAELNFKIINPFLPNDLIFVLK